MPAATSQAKSTTEIANAGFSHIQSTKAGAARTSPDFLVLVLDINPLAWTRRSEALGKGKGKEVSSDVALDDALSAIMILLNAHMAMQHENGLAIYAAAGTGTAQLLYSTASFSAKGPGSSSTIGSASSKAHHKPDANTYQHFKLVDDNLEQGIRDTCKSMSDRARQAQDAVEANESNEAAKHAALARSTNVGIVSALSQAICHLNRLGLSDATDAANVGIGIAASAQTRAGGGSNAASSSGGSGGVGSFKSRILILSVTPDASTQYIPMMNCIFAAQKKGITIDVCKLFGSDTVFLQQASYLTSGTYFRLADEAAANENKGAAREMRSSLVQTLLTTYLPSRSMIGAMNLPTLEEIDFRAACFCHRRIVDIGYICSVCLSLFCQPRPFCLTCRSNFPKDTLRRYERELQFTASSESTATAS